MPIKSYSPELIVHGCLRSGVEDAAGRERQADDVSKSNPRNPLRFDSIEFEGRRNCVSDGRTA